jgi:hypothetical protein
MDRRLNDIIETVEREFAHLVEKGSRHYLEVSISKKAQGFGYDDLMHEFRDAYAIVPLKQPQSGMKVRIDGRSFANYGEYDSGIVVPGYLAAAVGKPYKTYVPNDSMICNFV